jgi:hypothetical protein
VKVRIDVEKARLPAPQDNESFNRWVCEEGLQKLPPERVQTLPQITGGYILVDGQSTITLSSGAENIGASHYTTINLRLSFWSFTEALRSRA